MATNTPGSSARQDPRQVSNTMRMKFDFTKQGVFVPLGTLPQGAWIIACQVSIDTIFNAGTTNPITVGSAVTPAGLQSSGQNTPGSVGVYPTPGGAGSLLGKSGIPALATADTVVGITYTPTGGAPTTGQGEVMIEYEGGFPGQTGIQGSG